jgi:hypothetical protein
VSKGLKLSECEWGIGGKNSPIRYIPKKDPVQEALEKTKKTNYFKLTLLNTGSKLKVALWASRTPEQFILQVCSAIHACKQTEHDIKYLNTKEEVTTANLDLDIKKEEYTQVRTSEKRKNKGIPGEGASAASESLVAAKTAYDKAKQALEAVKLATATEIAKAFELYGNLLYNEARQPWDNIVQAQMSKCPWEDIYNRCSGMTRAKP